MARASYRIKLSSALRPFVGRVVRNGKIQRAFAQTIGASVGQCVKVSVSKGMSGGAIKNAVRVCAREAKGRTIPGFPGSGRGGMPIVGGGFLQ